MFTFILLNEVHLGLCLFPVLTMSPLKEKKNWKEESNLVQIWAHDLQTVDCRPNNLTMQDSWLWPVEMYHSMYHSLHVCAWCMYMCILVNACMRRKVERRELFAINAEEMQLLRQAFCYPGPWKYWLHISLAILTSAAPRSILRLQLLQHRISSASGNKGFLSL